MRLVTLALIFLLIPAASAGVIVYDNTATDTLDSLGYSVNGYTAAGDQILLSGTARFATLATAQFYNNGDAGTFDAILRLYNVGSPVGAQIGPDFTVSAIPVLAASEVNVGFSLGDLLVPDNVIFLLSVGNLSGGVDIIGPDMFEPPTVGSSDPSFAVAFDGTNFVQAGTSSEDVFFQLTADSVATPEPVTAVLAGFGLLAVALVRRRALRTGR